MVRHLLGLFLTTSFITWLAVTVAWNVPRVSGWVFSRLSLGRVATVIPSWSFFAPNPGDTDYSLLYREQLRDGSFTAWREVRLPASGRRAWALWNPWARPRKVLHDTIAHLARLTVGAEEPQPHLVLSVPYLMLLHRLTMEATTLGAVGRQFAVLRYRANHGVVTPAVVEPALISYLHRTEPP